LVYQLSNKLTRDFNVAIAITSHLINKKWRWQKVNIPKRNR